jgi:hypothetical protein
MYDSKCVMMIREWIRKIQKELIRVREIRAGMGSRGGLDGRQKYKKQHCESLDCIEMIRKLLYENRGYCKNP